MIFFKKKVPFLSLRLYQERFLEKNRGILFFFLNSECGYPRKSTPWRKWYEKSTEKEKRSFILLTALFSLY